MLPGLDPCLALGWPHTEITRGALDSVGLPGTPSWLGHRLSPASTSRQHHVPGSIQPRALCRGLAPQQLLLFRGLAGGLRPPPQSPIPSCWGCAPLSWQEEEESSCCWGLLVLAHPSLLTSDFPAAVPACNPASCCGCKSPTAGLIQLLPGECQQRQGAAVVIHSPLSCLSGSSG